MNRAERTAHARKHLAVVAEEQGAEGPTEAEGDEFAQWYARAPRAAELDVETAYDVFFGF